MKIVRLIGLLAAGLLMVIIQVTWFQSFSWIGLAVNAPLLLVLVLANRLDWPSSFVMAVVLGGVYQLFSTLPTLVHPAGFILAVLGTRLLRQRLATSRTSTSLLVSVWGGTAIYYAVVASSIFIAHLFQEVSLIPIWSVWLTAVIWQMIVHPVVAGLWWILSRQRRAALHIGTW